MTTDGPDAALSPDLLAILRCPLSQGRARLAAAADALTCERCALRFPIRDGFPILVVEEAALPPGCESVAQLPCQQDGNGRGAN